MTDPTNDVAMRKLRRQMEAEAKVHRAIATILESALAAIDPNATEEEQAAALLAAKQRLDVLKVFLGPGSGDAP